MVFSIGGYAAFFLRDVCESLLYWECRGKDDCLDRLLARKGRGRKDTSEGKLEQLGRGFDCDGQLRPILDMRLLAGRVLNESQTRKIASHPHAETHRPVDQAPKRFSKLHLNKQGKITLLGRLELVDGSRDTRYCLKRLVDTTSLP